jgi:hypothetical protein
MTWHRSMGHKGPVLRPRSIGTDRARPHYFDGKIKKLSLNEQNIYQYILFPADR